MNASLLGWSLIRRRSRELMDKELDLGFRLGIAEATLELHRRGLLTPQISDAIAAVKAKKA